MEKFPFIFGRSRQIFAAYSQYLLTFIRLFLLFPLVFIQFLPHFLVYNFVAVEFLIHCIFHDNIVRRAIIPFCMHHCNTCTAFFFILLFALFAVACNFGKCV